MAQLIIEYYGPRSGADYDEWKAESWARVRNHRDILMNETDWTQAGDAPLTDDKKAEFAAYRQTLRDIPQSIGDPDAVVWPTKPTI
ncbi:phage tail assembly chaperone [Vibrio fluvialis]|nr:phage tail assembly chaperone [Vibrio fluvialis]